jgi:hypothetical protein
MDTVFKVFVVVLVVWNIYETVQVVRLTDKKNKHL